MGGTIRGRVQDASGGVVAGAPITVRDTAKGLVYQTRTDSLGLYAVALPVGMYEVEAAAAKFAPVRQTGIPLFLGQTITLDFTLSVSGVQESIEVRAEVPLVETSNGTISGLVNR